MVLYIFVLAFLRWPMVSAQNLSGTFTLEIGVHSYTNTLHVALDTRGYCCDSPPVYPPTNCSDHCDNYLVFCLRSFGAPTGVHMVGLTDCARSNREETGLLEENNDNLTFTLGQPFLKSPNHSVVPNPVQLHGTNWDGRIQFVLQAADVDSSPTAIQLIDTLFLDIDAIDLLPWDVDGFTAPKNYRSSSGFFTVTLSFRMTCTQHYSGPICTICNEIGNSVCGDNGCLENYYGRNCTIFCQEEGRFMCTEEGEQVCTANYYGPLCTSCTETTNPECGASGCIKDYYVPNCTTFCRLSVRYRNNRKCNESGEKVCVDNYYGSDCQTFCKETENFVCNENGERSCMENYYGPRCDRFCKEEGHFVCTEQGERVCAENHYGPNCTTFCDANTREGNFMCNQDGDLVCLDKYHNPSTNCAECVSNHYGPTCSNFCNAGIQEGNFMCNQDGHLVCLDGYHNPSTNCTECVPKNGCSVDGGYCNQPGECLCREGYEGMLCDRTPSAAAVPVAAIASAVVAGIVTIIIIVIIIAIVVFTVLPWRSKRATNLSTNVNSAYEVTATVRTQKHKEDEGTSERQRQLMEGGLVTSANVTNITLDYEEIRH